MSPCKLRSRSLLGLAVLLTCTAFSPQGAAAAPIASAAATPLTLVIKMERRGANLVITASGLASTKSIWLGCSMYPRGVRNAVIQGNHNGVLVSSGFSHSWVVPAGFEGGTYEVALWADRVLRKDCKLRFDPWCARNGYHMTGLLQYRGGKLSLTR